jgi:hypothetical protein
MAALALVRARERLSSLLDGRWRWQAERSVLSILTALDPIVIKSAFSSEADEGALTMTTFLLFVLNQHYLILSESISSIMIIIALRLSFGNDVQL